MPERDREDLTGFETGSTSMTASTVSLRMNTILLPDFVAH